MISANISQAGGAVTKTLFLYLKISRFFKGLKRRTYESLGDSLGNSAGDATELSVSLFPYRDFGWDQNGWYIQQLYRSSNTLINPLSSMGSTTTVAVLCGRDDTAKGGRRMKTMKRPEKRKRIRLRLFYKWNKDGILKLVARQLAGLVLLGIGIVLAVPGVPGPGFLFIFSSLLVSVYPGKKKLVAWMQNKRFFRLTRVWLRRTLNVHLVVPRNGNRFVNHNTAKYAYGDYCPIYKTELYPVTTEHKEHSSVS